MSSFKKLIKSDVSVVPYEANKQWTLAYCPYPTSSQYLTIYKGTNVPGLFSTDTDPVTENQYERLVYAQINHLFYQAYTGSLNTSSLANSIYYESASQQRPTSSYFIYNDKSQLVKHFPTGANEGIRVIAVNQSTYGNKILPYTFMLSSSGYFITDDGFGNLLTLQGSVETYIINGYFNATGYFAENIIDDNSYIGNIFYAQGIAVITNQSFQTMFPLPPLTVNDTVYFQTTDSPKTVSPLTNDSGRGGTIDNTTLTLSGSASELASWTNNGNGTVQLNATTAGTYTIYYTVEASYTCGNIVSNKSKITAVVTTTPPPTTTSTTTTTTTAAPTTTSTTTTTTTAAPTTTTTSTTTTTTTAAPTTTTTTTTTSTTTTTTTAAPTTTSTTTTTTTTSLQAISVRLSTDITLCGTSPVIRYVDGGVLSGMAKILYLADLTTPVTGFNYVVESTGGIIYEIDPGDGGIGNNTGDAC
jgi:hypothetical protein